ncbi:unnamed protein product [Prorocentrum cordatum]|uniref:Zuotin-like zuotin homology domain-containing protein n=1 Tax=Prorocentrum cordatum TaxID=2364126 RepID=A0ABN9UWT2_9DINO|nr:unnamed protein product [Polarella glacialis]
MGARRKYDSIGDFDDSVPSGLRDGQDFFEVFGPVFKRNARWSEHKPVPDLGGPETPHTEVVAFYDWWREFESFQTSLAQPYPAEWRLRAAANADHLKTGDWPVARQGRERRIGGCTGATANEAPKQAKTAEGRRGRREAEDVTQGRAKQGGQAAARREQGRGVVDLSAPACVGRGGRTGGALGRGDGSGASNWCTLKCGRWRGPTAVEAARNVAIVGDDLSGLAGPDAGAGASQLVQQAAMLVLGELLWRRRRRSSGQSALDDVLAERRGEGDMMALVVEDDAAVETLGIVGPLDAAADRAPAAQLHASLAALAIDGFVAVLGGAAGEECHDAEAGVADRAPSALTDAQPDGQLPFDAEEVQQCGDCTLMGAVLGTEVGGCGCGAPKALAKGDRAKVVTRVVPFGFAWREAVGRR